MRINNACLYVGHNVLTGYKSIRSKSNLSQTNSSQFWLVRSNFKSIRPTLLNLSQLKTIRPKNVGRIDQILVNLSQLFFFITSKFGTNWPKDGQFVPTVLFVTAIELTLNKTLTLNPKTLILNPNPKALILNP